MQGGNVWAEGRGDSTRANSHRGPRALAFSCSPRGRRGATELVLRSFIRGFEESGGVARLLNPYELNIEPCRGCFACWTRTRGRCVIDDDMARVLDGIQNADAIILATPVYHFTFSEGMKRLLERTMPLLEPRVQLSPDGRTRHRRLGPRGQWAVLIATCGLPELEVFDSLLLAFREICDMMEWNLRAVVLRTMAGLLLSKDERHRDKIEAYLQLVRSAGKKVAGGEVLESGFRAHLEAELLPREQYLEATNRFLGLSP
ncbi:MAG: flavodoxin family protein [Thermoplasmata archaeon]